MHGSEQKFKKKEKKKEAGLNHSLWNFGHRQ